MYNANGKMVSQEYSKETLGEANELVSVDLIRASFRLSYVADKSVGKNVEQIRLLPSQDKNVSSWITLGASA